MACKHERISVETMYDSTGREVAYRVCEDCGKTLADLGFTGERV